ncbi:MAG: histidine phosphatase family protein [Cyclobacteriaceae bacterium]|nr:histidine phosphatase family protein [Cyclobacteriaceae bacterium]
MAKLNLYLLRHARTQDRQGNQTDIERELSTVGLQNSTRMGMNLSNKNLQFDMIVSSPAIRAITTSGLVAEQLKYDTNNIYINDEVYDASIRNLLKIVNNFKNEWKNVLLVGHNPAITYLAEYISDGAIGDMTTCGLVHIQFQGIKWDAISEHSGKFISYIYPDLLNF